MTLQEYIAETKSRPADLARAAGVNRSYIHRVLQGEKSLSRRAALRIWEARAIKLHPIDGLSDADVRTLLRIGEAA